MRYWQARRWYRDASGCAEFGSVSSRKFPLVPSCIFSPFMLYSCQIVEIRGNNFHEKGRPLMNKLRTKLATQLSTMRTTVEKFEAMVHDPAISASELDQF